MTGSLIERTLNVLELLSAHVEGVSVTHVAEQVGLPKSGAHRILGELVRLNYVRKLAGTERYQLTTRLVTFGLTYLSASGIIDICQPILDRLAEESKELVRLAVVNGSQLTWVAKAQGTRTGIMYDTEMGGHPILFCTATGLAWLAQMKEEEAVRIVMAEGFGGPDDFGPNAPRTVPAFLEALRQTREKGYAYVTQSADEWTSAMAATIVEPKTGMTAGTISIAGPYFRLTASRAQRLSLILNEAVRELGAATAGSKFFHKQGVEGEL